MSWLQEDRVALADVEDRDSQARSWRTGPRATARPGEHQASHQRQPDQNRAENP
jgi:hypothetical protein